eukprot:544131_1
MDTMSKRHCGVVDLICKGKGSMTASYAPFAFDMNDNEYKLVSGYIRNIESEFVLCSIIPHAFVRLIYSFHQHYILIANDLCTIYPNKRILTTCGAPKDKREGTYVILSKPLLCGIENFEIKCITSAKKSISIGIVTNLEADVPSNRWLFDHKECGESFQLFIASEKRRFKNAIYHFISGKEIYKKTVESIKNDELKSNQKCGFTIDFNERKITFWINSDQIAYAMTIGKNVTYYAAVTYSANSDFYHETGAPQFQYTLS